jgi:hypothetical protein
MAVASTEPARPAARLDAATPAIERLVLVSSESSRNHRAPSGWCPLACLGQAARFVEGIARRGCATVQANA